MITALLVVASLAAALGVAVVASARGAVDRIGRTRPRDLGADASPPIRRVADHPGRVRAVLVVLELGFVVVVGALAALAGRRVGDVVGEVVGVLLAVALTVVGEVSGATVGSRHAPVVVRRTAGPVAALGVPLRPVTRLLLAVASRLSGSERLVDGPYDQRDRSEAPDPHELEEEELHHSVTEFGETVLHEVMTPRTDMTVVSCTTPAREALDVLLAEGWSRAPCYEDDVDHVRGLLILKDLVRATRDGDGDTEVGVFMRPAVFVPEQKRVAELLREMRTRRFHMAIVVDEYGGTAGLVTIEDLLEELVGEIADEFDDEEDELRIEVLDDRTVRASGKVPIAELNELLGTHFADTEWDTLGGLVLHLLGRLPDAGESGVHEGVRLMVDRLQGRRVAAVRVQLPEPRPQLAALRAGSGT